MSKLLKHSGSAGIKLNYWNKVWLSLSSPLRGHDIFISYSRKDASAYVAALAKRLSAEGYKCFIDQYGTQPERENLPHKLYTLVFQSNMLVFVASDAALLSENVQKEVFFFIREKHRKERGTLCTIDFDSFKETSWVIELKLDTLAHVKEQQTDINQKRPSDVVVRFIEDNYKYNKQNKKLFRAAVATFSILLVLLGISVLMGIRTRNSARLLAAEEAKLDITSRQADSIQNQARHLRAENRKAEDSIRIADQKLVLSAGALKESNKEAVAAILKVAFINEQYRQVLDGSVAALRKYAQRPGQPRTWCDTNSITPADMKLLVLAALASNFLPHALPVVRPLLPHLPTRKDDLFGHESFAEISGKGGLKTYYRLGYTDNYVKANGRDQLFSVLDAKRNGGLYRLSRFDMKRRTFILGSSVDFTFNGLETGVSVYTTLSGDNSRIAVWQESGNHLQGHIFLVKADEISQIGTFNISTEAARGAIIHLLNNGDLVYTFDKKHFFTYNLQQQQRNALSLPSGTVIMDAMVTREDMVLLTGKENKWALYLIDQNGKTSGPLPLPAGDGTYAHGFPNLDYFDENYLVLNEENYKYILERGPEGFQEVTSSGDLNSIFDPYNYSLLYYNPVVYETSINPINGIFERSIFNQQQVYIGQYGPREYAFDNLSVCDRTINSSYHTGSDEFPGLFVSDSLPKPYYQYINIEHCPEGSATLLASWNYNPKLKVYFDDGLTRFYQSPGFKPLIAPYCPGINKKDLKDIGTDTPMRMPSWITNASWYALSPDRRWALAGKEKGREHGINIVDLGSRRNLNLDLMTDKIKLTKDYYMQFSKDGQFLFVFIGGDSAVIRINMPQYIINLYKL